MSKLKLEVTNYTDTLKNPKKRTEVICNCLNTSRFKISSGTLSVAFVDDKCIRDLHRNFFNDPSSTDVITFLGEPNFNFSGEIVISVDQAIKQSTEFGTAISDELTLYLVHGWLHLSGFNDKTTEQKKAMRISESEACLLINKIPRIKDFQIKTNPLQRQDTQVD